MENPGAFLFCFVVMAGYLCWITPVVHLIIPVVGFGLIFYVFRELLFG